MRISCYSLMLSLFLGPSIISANPLTSLSRRGSTDLVEPSGIRVNCNGRVYPAYMLDSAATKVCSQINKKTHCRNFMSCLYIKKAIPGIPSVSRYAGILFPEYKNGGSLLKLPLKKASYLERTQYFAIVYKRHDTGKCQAIGAIQKTNNEGYIRCNGIMNGAIREPRLEELLKDEKI